MEAGCENCKHSNLAVYDDNTPMLKCFRYPPTVFVDGDGEVCQTVPEAVHVCGEHQFATPTLKFLTLRERIDQLRKSVGGEQ